jgi:hypothetical protein
VGCARGHCHCHRLVSIPKPPLTNYLSRSSDSREGLRDAFRRFAGQEGVHDGAEGHAEPPCPLKHRVHATWTDVGRDGVRWPVALPYFGEAPDALPNFCLAQSRIAEQDSRSGWALQEIAADSVDSDSARGGGGDRGLFGDALLGPEHDVGAGAFARDLDTRLRDGNALIQDLTPSPDSGTVGCQERTGDCCMEGPGLDTKPCHASRCAPAASLAQCLHN